MLLRCVLLRNPCEIRSQSAILIDIDERADTGHGNIIVIRAYDLLRADRLTAGDRRTKISEPHFVPVRAEHCDIIMSVRAYLHVIL